MAVKAFTKFMARPKVEQVMLYRKGFGDGSKMLAKKHPDDPSYELGYTHGLNACGQAVSKFCKDIGYDNSMDILR